LLFSPALRLSREEDSNLLPGNELAQGDKSGKYRNCLRINCALPPIEKHKEVMVKLGEAVKVARYTHSNYQ
jgi:DNA-binding transcriptional MocR family regulator